VPGEVRFANRFEAWRDIARRLLAARLEPDSVIWNDGTSRSESLFEPISLADLQPVQPNFSVPAEFVARCEYVACHRDAARWSLMYRMLWRIANGEKHLLELASDEDVGRFELMHRAVRRDRHKMTAFVRFRRLDAPDGGAEQYVAWHKPEHYIVRLTAPFFRDRFAALHWTILTPDESVSWDGHTLCFAPGVTASYAPQADELETLWKTYYGSTFNPARINLRAMRREMPLKHWPTLPETAIIDDLLAEAPKRVEDMVKRTASTTCASTGSAADFLPDRISLPQLRSAAEGCRGCELYCNATQVVFGEGARDAFVIFVGEQPGDQEDLAGKPFVGPSGQLLDQVLEEAGIDRKNDVYVTNAVKHFKFEQRGKRRLHSKPSAREVAACRPWLESEIKVIKPRIIVCLGATAAQSLLGSAFRVTKHMGEVMENQPWAPWMMATYHPSALLRMPDEAARREARVSFTNDMRKVAKKIQQEKSR